MGLGHDGVVGWVILNQHRQSVVSTNIVEASDVFVFGKKLGR